MMSVNYLTSHFEGKKPMVVTYAYAHCGQMWSWGSLSYKLKMARRAFFAFGTMRAFHWTLNSISARSIFETCVVPVWFLGCHASLWLWKLDLDRFIATLMDLNHSWNDILVIGYWSCRSTLLSPPIWHLDLSRNKPANLYRFAVSLALILMCLLFLTDMPNCIRRRKFA